MSQWDSDLEEQLRVLEESHLRPEVRSSAEALQALLAEDFVEFGSSGRLFNRAAAVEAAGREATLRWRVEEFTVRSLGPTVALATYRLWTWSGSHDHARITLRSSVWVQRDRRWLLVFHQGTPAHA